MKLPDKASLAITLLSIFTCMFVSAQVYAIFQDSMTNSSIYNMMEAIGSIFMGFLSDKFCRRKTGILSHFLGLTFLVIIFLHPQLKYAIFMMGFFYNPLPILRAGLVDNFTKIPRLYLLMISFVIQFIPWSFYVVYVDANPKTMLLIAIALVTLCTLGSYFFFRDKRDQNVAERSRLKGASIIHPSARKRVLYTFFAFFIMELVFFFTDNLQEKLADAPRFYSVISTATTICVLLALALKDISHVSVLRVNYGILAALSFVPVIALFLFKIPTFDSAYMIVMLSGFGAFTLPFVYDITMNSVNANYRGTACGMLDFAFNASTLFNTSFIVFVNLNKFTTYSIVALGLCVALFLQTRAEKHREIATP